MSSPENRVVGIEFDSKSFEKSIERVIQSLETLNKTLDDQNKKTAFEGLTKEAEGFNLDQVTAALAGSEEAIQNLADKTGSFNMEHISAALDNISGKFSALGAMGFAAIQRLTNAAIDLAKSLVMPTIDAVLGGGKQRALNLEQARFMFQGLGMDIEASMASALEAVKGTAYGLDAAAKVAAQFGGAGIQAGEEMTAALRGISGMAAMTGRSYEEIGQVMTGIAGVGKLTGQDLMQFGVRGLNVAAKMAEQMGITEKEVREMVSNSEIDFKTFAAMMDDAFGAHATKANEIYTGSVSNLKAALSRIGASIQAPKLEAMRRIFNALTPVVDKFAKAIKPAIAAWAEFQNTKADKVVSLLENIDLTNWSSAIKNITVGVQRMFRQVGRIFSILGDSFRNIFPKSGVDNLGKFALAFRLLTSKLVFGEETANKLKRVFSGVFAALEIGWTIVKEVAKTFGTLFDVFNQNTNPGGILDFFAKLGDKMTLLNEKLVEGGGITKFFDTLRDAIRNPLPYLEKLRNYLIDLRDRIVTFLQSIEIGGKRVTIFDNLPGLFDRIAERFSSLKNVALTVIDIFKSMGRGISAFWEAISPTLSKAYNAIRTWLSELGSKLANAIKTGDFDKVLDVINVGLLGGIAALLAKFFKDGLKFDIGDGFFGKIGTAVEELTGVFEAMQTKLKADALMKIAQAIALMVGAVFVLSLVDSEALTKSLTAMAVGIGQLIGVMVLINSTSVGPTSAAQFTAIATGLTILAGACLVLAGAVAIFSMFSWEELARGLVGVAGSLSILVGAIALLTKIDPSGLKLMLISVGLAAVGGSLILIAGAAKIFSTMSWEEIGKGMAGIGGGLAIIALALNLMPVTTPIIAAGLVIMGIALAEIAGAVMLMSTMSWAEMGKGMAVLASSLGIIALALNLMPAWTPLIAAGLVLVGYALKDIGEAMVVMGSMSWGDIAKGLVAMGGALLVISAGLFALTLGALGAVTLGIFAVSLGLLVDVLARLAQMKTGEVAKALGLMAAALIAVALTSAVVAPFSLLIGVLAISLGALGLAMVLFGAGALLTATAFSVMAKAGEAGIKTLAAAIDLFVDKLPSVLKALALAISSSIVIFLEQMPAVIEAFGVVIEMLLSTIISFTPELVEAVIALALGLLEAIRAVFPDYVKTGFEMLLAILTGLRDNMDEITALVAEIVTKFLDGMAEHTDEIIDSLYNLWWTIFTGVIGKMASIGSLLVEKGKEFLGGLLDGVNEKGNEVAKWFNELPGNILKWIGEVSTKLKLKGIDFLIGLIKGIDEKVTAVTTWFKELPGKILDWIGDVSTKLKFKGVALLKGFLEGIIQKAADVIEWFRGLGGRVVGYVGNVLSTLWQKGVDLIQGLLNGMWSMKDKVVSLAKEVAGWVTNPLGKAWEMLSPSKVTTRMGRYLGEGIVIGLDSSQSSVVSSSKALGEKTTDALAKAMADIPKHLVEMEEFNPTITPVLDLSGVEREARRIGGYVNPESLSPAFSYSQARNISLDTQANREAAQTDQLLQGNKEIKFEQNIHAPTELSTADIYRQTRNLVTLVKEELEIP